MNPYRYCLNNPLGSTDPSGLSASLPSSYVWDPDSSELTRLVGDWNVGGVCYEWGVTPAGANPVHGSDGTVVYWLDRSTIGPDLPTGPDQPPIHVGDTEVITDSATVARVLAVKDPPPPTAKEPRYIWGDDWNYGACMFRCLQEAGLAPKMPESLKKELFKAITGKLKEKYFKYIEEATYGLVKKALRWNPIKAYKARRCIHNCWEEHARETSGNNSGDSGYGADPGGTWDPWRIEPWR